MEIVITLPEDYRKVAVERALAAYNAKVEGQISLPTFVQKLIDGKIEGLVGAYTTVDISKVAFLSRMTQEERITIREAAKVDPAVFDYMELLNASPIVTLTDPRTIGGINALEAGGLLQPGRAAEILAL